MMKDVMLDLETLGTRSTSAIIQIGACYFDRDTGEIGQTFSMNVAFDPRFTVDHRTIMWWLLLPEEARQSVAHDHYSIDMVLQTLCGWIKEAEYVWSHATFDMPILNNAFEVCGVEFPVPYKRMRDIRTLMDLADHHGNKEERQGIHHNALDDCRFQVEYCVQAFNKLKK